MASMFCKFQIEPMPNGKFKFSCIRDTCRNKDLIQSDDKPSIARCTAVSGARRTMNFTVAAIVHVWNICPTCTDDEIKARHEICKLCPLYVKKNEHVGYCSHKSCGCSISDMSGFVKKVAWADQHCPIGKW